MNRRKRVEPEALKCLLPRRKFADGDGVNSWNLRSEACLYRLLDCFGPGEMDHGTIRSLRARSAWTLRVGAACLSSPRGSGSRWSKWSETATDAWQSKFQCLLLSLTQVNHLIASSPCGGFPGGSAGKESACNAGDLGSVPGLGRSPGEGNGYPLQYSGLENSMSYIVHGVAESWTQLSDFHFHTFPFFK